jgi:hypothetical protein
MAADPTAGAFALAQESVAALVPPASADNFPLHQAGTSAHSPEDQTRAGWDPFGVTAAAHRAGSPINESPRAPMSSRHKAPAHDNVAAPSATQLVVGCYAAVHMLKQLGAPPPPS